MSDLGAGAFLVQQFKDKENTVRQGLASITPDLKQIAKIDPTAAAFAQAGATGVQNAGATNTTSTDDRVRLTALNPADVYVNSAIMKILNETNGVIFPYTPTITFTQAVNYMDLQLVHSNTDYAAYTRTPSVSLSVSGKFTVQNSREGEYVLACLHFLRTVSKSFFGQTDPERAGLPPPVLVFSGYGNCMFNKLNVILKSHSYTFDDSVDMVKVNVSSGTAKLPAMFTVQCDLTVVQTPARMREQFNFKKFASGELLSSTAGGWI